MLQKIKIINFRSIENLELIFEDINGITGKNWAGKTNILQAICLVFFHQNIFFSPDNILRNGEKHLYIEALFEENDFSHTLTFSFDAEQNKKLITLNGKKVSKKILWSTVLKICYFSPLEMNLFYLGPKTRRDFLDNILKNIFPEYDTLLKDYEKIVKNRNKVLKNIFEEKSKKTEIDFWDNALIQKAKKIYEYRLPLVDFFWEYIKWEKNIFQNQSPHIEFQFISKVKRENIEGSMKKYLEENLERDIILGRTHIGPHLDDFDILIDGKNIVHFASRWEIKSILISLKFCEIKYIQKNTGKIPLLLIDDLASELDEEHLYFIETHFQNFQIIYTSILPIQREKTNIILF